MNRLVGKRIGQIVEGSHFFCQFLEAVAPTFALRFADRAIFNAEAFLSTGFAVVFQPLHPGFTVVLGDFVFVALFVSQNTNPSHRGHDAS